MKRTTQLWGTIALATITSMAFFAFAQAVEQQDTTNNAVTETKVMDSGNTTKPRLVPKRRPLPPISATTATTARERLREQETKIEEQRETTRERLQEQKETAREKMMEQRDEHIANQKKDCIRDESGKTDCVETEGDDASTTARERLRERKEQAREKIKEQKEKHEEKRDARMEKRRQLRDARINAYTERMVHRFDVAIDRLSKIADRIDSRIEKFTERGADTTEAQNAIASAQTKITAAKQETDTIKTDIDEALSSDDPKGAFKEVRTIVSDAVTTIKDIHATLIEAVKSLQGIGNNMNDENKAESSTQEATSTSSE